MVECPFCETQIEEKYQICPSCDQRVKCKNCGDYLFEGADECYVCGESIAEEDTDTMNTFELREERTEEGGSKKVNIEISNEGMENAGRIVERLFSTGQQFDSTRKIQTEQDDEEQPPPALPPEQEGTEVKGGSEDGEDSVDGSSKDERKESEGEEETPEEEELSSIDARDVDYNYEMTIISLYHLTERGSMDHAKPREIYENIGNIFKRVPFSESSNRGYVSNRKGEFFKQDDDGGYFLTVEGLQRAEKIVS